MWPIDKPATERRVALIVVVVFAVSGSAWILFSDLLLYSVIQDRERVARLETAKGWAFVAVSALVLYLVTLRSVAKLARASRTLSAIVESIGDGVLLLGSDRTISYANPASIRMLQASGPDDLRGMNAEEFSRRFHVSYPDGRLVPPDQFISQRVFDEAGRIRYKAVLYPPAGPEIVIICTAAAVRTDIEKPPEIVVSVLHDITATEHLDRLRDELFSAAAHAIRTPVAVIKSASQILIAGKPSHADRAITMIERQCARIERLVENILVLSRLRSGTLQLHPAKVDLGPMVESVGREVARISHGHGIRVRVDAHSRVRGDAERLTIALRNSIHAATRSSQAGEPVTVRLDRRDDDAEVSISYQPDPRTAESGDVDQPGADFDDLGVARHVTAKIMEAHGGTITEQADDNSVTIRMRLPTLAEGAM